MSPAVTELSVWLSPIMLALLGFFFGREFRKMDDQFKEVFAFIRERLPQMYITHDKCQACKSVADERRANCRDYSERMDKTIHGLTEQIDRLEECLIKITTSIEGQVKC